VEAAVVDAVLTASRTLVAVSTPSLGAAAEHTTTAQYRMLVVLASRGSQRMTDLAAALDVAPSTAGRMTDRLSASSWTAGIAPGADRRSVMVSVTAAGRQVVDEATARRRVLIEDILAKLPRGQQQAHRRGLRSVRRRGGRDSRASVATRPGSRICRPRAFPLDVARQGLDAVEHRIERGASGGLVSDIES